MHLDPFEPTNKLVMVGCLTDQGNEYLYSMDRREYTSCWSTRVT